MPLLSTTIGCATWKRSLARATLGSHCQPLPHLATTAHPLLMPRLALSAAGEATPAHRHSPLHRLELGERMRRSRARSTTDGRTPPCPAARPLSPRSMPLLFPPPRPALAASHRRWLGSLTPEAGSEEGADCRAAARRCTSRRSSRRCTPSLAARTRAAAVRLFRRRCRSVAGAEKSSHRAPPTAASERCAARLLREEDLRA